MIKHIFKFLFPKKAPVAIRRQTYVHQGLHYNLKEIYDRVNADYFESRLQIPIRWFGNRESKPKTRITLGSYHLHKQEIKINRVLDQSHIPDYFISYIVYHEMLHHVLPPIKKRGRKRYIHHAEFSQKEKDFAHYKQAKEFSKSIKKEWFVR